MSSNFIFVPFRAVSGLFFSSLERQREKTSRNGAKGRTQAGGGGRARVAARCVTNTLYRLARHRRMKPERTTEPRPSGVHLEEGEVEKRQPSLPSGVKRV